MTKVPRMTKVTKYAGAPGTPQHSPMAQSIESSQSSSTMASYMMAFHASPVTMRSKMSIELPKLRKFACSFKFSPNFTLPKSCIPSTAYTKQSKNRSDPMLTKPGREMTRVLKSMRRPLSLRTSLKIRARRKMRRTLAPPPAFAANPMIEVATQKKSNRFHRFLKYPKTPNPMSLITASAMNTAAQRYDTTSSASVQASVC